MKSYLVSQASRMGIEMNECQAQMFVKYHEMLMNANREMNLTRIGDDVREAADRNYLDSLTILTHLREAKTVIDVGTGAGFPGIPLAIMCPDIRVTLLDALGKRVTFLKKVVEELGLNAVCVLGRAEEAAKDPNLRDAFDIAAARAVAEMNVLSEWLLPFVKPGGRMLALKGPAAEDEVSRAQAAIEKLNAQFAAVHETSVPGRDWTHRIVEVRKIGTTPEQFPRRVGVAEKRPLK